MSRSWIPLTPVRRELVQSRRDPGQVTAVSGDIRDEELMNGLVRGMDVIFNLAAQVSYIDSSSIPFETPT